MDSGGPKPARSCGRTWRQHSLVVARIVIVGLMMISAFFVLGVAIIVVGNHWACVFGVCWCDNNRGDDGTE